MRPRRAAAPAPPDPPAPRGRCDPPKARPVAWPPSRRMAAQAPAGMNRSAALPEQDEGRVDQILAQTAPGHQEPRGAGPRETPESHAEPPRRGGRLGVLSTATVMGSTRVSAIGASPHQRADRHVRQRQENAKQAVRSHRHVNPSGRKPWRSHDQGDRPTTREASASRVVDRTAVGLGFDPIRARADLVRGARSRRGCR